MPHKMWNVVVHKNERMVWIERELRDDRTPPPTAPICSKAHPSWPWVSGGSWLCHSNSPWHNICSHYSFPHAPGFGAMAADQAWPVCQIPPSQVQSSPREPWETPEKLGLCEMLQECEHLGAASRNSHLPSHPSRATGGTNRCGKGIRALAGHPASMGETQESHTGGDSSPCSCLRAQFSFQEQPPPAELPAQRSAHCTAPLWGHLLFWLVLPVLMSCHFKKNHTTATASAVFLWTGHQHIPSTTA